MVNRVNKLRWRRRYKRSKLHLETIGRQAEHSLEKNFFKRFGNFVGIRRFVTAWILLICLLGGGVVMQTQALSNFYQELQPASGGIYTEGILGSFTNANPIFATGQVDSSVSRLIFSGLMKYDSDNQLAGDLATKIESNQTATEYTVNLRGDATWHDGKPVTAEDVVFTYKTIQNPDAQSPLYPNWQGVKIETKNSTTVVFKLPHSLASFPHSLTSGIVPRHLLSNIPPAQLRSVAFNSAQPVGSGPFKWGAVQVSGATPESREEQVGLVKNEDYYLGAPKLDKFIVRAIHDKQALINSIEKREITAAVGLETVPENISKEDTTHEFNIPLMGEVMVFLRNSHAILSDVKVRQALTMATDSNEIIKGLGYPVIKSDSILLKSHLGYDSKMTQFNLNVEKAKKLLAEAGWKKINEQGIREKNGQELTFRLFSKDSEQYTYVSGQLQKQWRDVGVNLEVVLQSDEELQTTIAFHNYDALLYGISLGNDPDIYAYWHSSQSDPGSAGRLNFAEYKSKIVDQALEGGRSRVNPKQRVIKYKPMLASWRNDAPAIALYQPRFLYITTDEVHGFDPVKLSSSTDRFSDVQNWAIREELSNIL